MNNWSTQFSLWTLLLASFGVTWCFVSVAVSSSQLALLCFAFLSSALLCLLTFFLCTDEWTRGTSITSHANSLPTSLSLSLSLPLPLSLSGVFLVSMKWLLSAPSNARSDTKKKEGPRDTFTHANRILSLSCCCCFCYKKRGRKISRKLDTWRT